MAPPEHSFPVGALDQRVHYRTVEFKEKSRKLRGDFDLKRDCELLELVQYSCTTPEQQYQRAMASPTGTARMECFPFVRLFRKCQEKSGKVFHVETTAWEGEHAWTPPAKSQPTAELTTKDTATSTSEEDSIGDTNSFANYGNYFWSRK
ncbi:hypothetical protein A1O1_03192 [Capronia coronata CBS 617.96]|uniref:Uncharacterized protein n=1 Tax=Capronia coronata CBS 617.96 TaxID=1182541 RepID=W9ZJT3_9EURO|nr:uncharacterized protein A1O1_03192 [Capronia coronata CBS 617.96]EXJ94794.1 hypothetical protein A1O1_03192 [Capronia coronata CBS 617.96]